MNTPYTSNLTLFGQYPLVKYPLVPGVKLPTSKVTCCLNKLDSCPRTQTEYIHCVFLPRFYTQNCCKPHFEKTNERGF